MGMRHWRYAAPSMGLALVLAGCATHRAPVAEATKAPPAPPIVDKADIPLSAKAATLSQIWHMRVALNVAALACRGPGSSALVAGYNRMLHKRDALLAMAQEAAYADYGGRSKSNGYDSAMTRLYNHYAQPFAQADFCTTAQRVQRAEEKIAEASYRQFVAAALDDLDAPFAAPPARQAQARLGPARLTPTSQATGRVTRASTPSPSARKRRKR